MFVRGCLDLPTGIDDVSSATQFIRGFPTEGLPPASRNRDCQFNRFCPSLGSVEPPYLLSAP